MRLWLLPLLLLAGCGDDRPMAPCPALDSYDRVQVSIAGGDPYQLHDLVVQRLEKAGLRVVPLEPAAVTSSTLLLLVGTSIDARQNRHVAITPVDPTSRQQLGYEEREYYGGQAMLWAARLALDDLLKQYHGYNPGAAILRPR